MPNGIMTGNGSRNNPWIVEDAYDFNALRDVPHTDNASVGFVELGADISLEMFQNFVPIAGRFLNIDGKGHKIFDVSINAISSAGNTGLFATLAFTEYIRNIVIEGSIAVTRTGTSTTGVGFLAGVINFPNVTSTIENIEVYGNINAHIQGAAGTGMMRLGGVMGAAVINVALAGATQTRRIRNCFFKGTALAHVGNTNTGAGFDMTFGGIIGVAEISGAATNFTIHSCMANTKLFISGTTGTGVRGGIFGGLIGDLGGSTSAQSNRAILITMCVSRIAVYFNNAHGFNRPLICSGLMGRNNTSTASSMAAGTVATITLCACFLEINYDPTEPLLGQIDFHGIIGQGARVGIISAPCYAVIKYDNPNNMALPNIFNIHGLGHQNSVASVFFDETVLRKTWDGPVSQPLRGRTTEELQSVAFLANQGWVI